MHHEMHLSPAPFEAVRAGYKTIELRLYDEKRRAIREGDTVTFSRTDDPAVTLDRTVRVLHVFPDFAALYKGLPLLRCGYSPLTLAEASPADMEDFYPREAQERCQVVGIEFEEKPLQRFLAGQSGALPLCSGYETALAEIRSGEKRTHWIWYILPILRGLTHDPATEFYALENRREAAAFLAHPVFGAHLREMTEALLALETDDPVTVLGMIDAFKLHACMTLFDRLSPEDIFARALSKFCQGNSHEPTARLF